MSDFCLRLKLVSVKDSDPLPVLCNIESGTEVTSPDCLSDAASLQDTSGCNFHNLLSADQDSRCAPQSTGCSLPPAVIKKRGRGRPPIHNLSDKRKAQLKQVVASTFSLTILALPV